MKPPFQRAAPSPSPARSLIPGPAFWVGMIVAALLLVATPGQAGAKAVSQSYPPAGESFTVTGHGWGHGHGMSQYGARGAARAGLNYAQILAFYYPGTTLKTFAAPIRVRLMGDSGGVQVVAAEGLVARRADGSGTVALTATGVDRWRLVPAKGGNTLTYRRAADGVWATYGSFPGDAEFASRSGVLRVVTSTGTRDYRGAMRAVAASAGSTTRYTVNVLSIDEYVRGVVPAEMPTSWEPAAVQAQAVAARSYAAFEAEANKSRTYDLCDTTSCQVYGGVARETAAGNDAVAKTAGKIVAYKGKPAFTQFSSSHGGYSSPGSKPYLVGQADPYEAGSGNPYLTWTATVTTAAIVKAYPQLGALKAIRITDREGGGDWGGYVNTLVLEGTKKNVTLAGDTFRAKFGLRSRYYTFGDPTVGAVAAAAAAPAPAPAAPAARVIPTTRNGIVKELKTVAGKRIGKAKGSLVTRGSWSSLQFSNGIAYFNRNGTTYLLKGKLARKYIALGGTKSVLGAPTSTYTYKNGMWRATFTKGVLKYNSKTKRYTILRK